jgi:hypothetical protein
MKLRLHPSLLIAPLLGAAAAAQLSSARSPASARHALLRPVDVPEYVLPHPDVEQLMAEDEARGNWPARYGAVIPAGFSSDDAGRWDDVPSGELVWRLRLVSPGARSLGLTFDRYELPASGKVFVYGKTRATLLSASRARRASRTACSPCSRCSATSSRSVRARRRRPGRPDLRISEVIHDYRGILDELSSRTPSRSAAAAA